MQKLTKPPESPKIVSHAWIFDVDGVLTDPSKKRITEPQILDEIVKRLVKNEPVALNTGRSLAWIIDRVSSLLVKRVESLRILSSFTTVGEKGGTWFTFDEKGRIREFRDKTIVVPKFLQDMVKKLVKEEFSSVAFFDETKQTMISVEMHDNTAISEFVRYQGKLNHKLGELLEKYGLEAQLKVDPSTIATDIESKLVGKHLGARRITSWLKEKQIKPLKVVAFGDSQSDVAMAEELQSKYAVEFVFAGDPQKVNTTSLTCPITFTHNRFDKGTLEYLKAH